jgi:neutral ceramidase
MSRRLAVWVGALAALSLLIAVTWLLRWRQGRGTTDAPGPGGDESQRSAEADDTYLIGRAHGDITLPVVGVQMLGFVRPDQISEGLHQRQYARAFVIADAAGKSRLAVVICDIAFPTHTLKLAVLDRLRAKLGDRYAHANVVLAATHTHAAPGGFHHHLAASPLGGVLHGQCFDALAEGISEAILAADADLKPGRILFAQGDVHDAGVNRSRVAYMNNPAEERARYQTDVDTTMTLLKFVRDDGPIGVLNWFAVHPTSMNYHNKLISGDNKGYAAYAMEQQHGTRYAGRPEFVAAFAQSNCGDVTANLNLNNTGPGKTDVESTRIIGARQARTAKKLFEQAKEPLRGPVEFRHAFVDFSDVTVAGEFTGAGEQRTCPSALGYAFAAGSTEDGGGHPLFKEGMKQANPLIDTMVRATLPGLAPTKELRERQKPKAVLLATGLGKPPAQEQVLPLGLVRLGQLVLAVGPAEFTTMSGRRIRAAVAKELGTEPHYVIIAGYANDYAGYVATREEYDTQQYEGGHTVFGPWTETAYRQEYVRLARALKAGQPVESKAMPEDMRKRRMKSVSLDGTDERPLAGGKFGDIVTDAKERYAPGDLVTVTFWTGSPVNDYRRTDRFLAVERLDRERGSWEAVRADGDWDTTCRWQQLNPDAGPKPKKGIGLGALKISPPPRVARPDPYQATITWQTDAQTPPGTYRVVHHGRFRKGGKVERFVAASRAFEVGP